MWFSGISKLRGLGLVLAAAVLVRIIFLLWSFTGWNYFFLQQNLTDVYFAEGYALAAGYGYVWSNSPDAQVRLHRLRERVNADNTGALLLASESDLGSNLRPEMLHPPGLSLLVAGINHLFGIRADIPVQLVGIALDTAAVGTFWWILTTFITPQVGFIGGLLYALFPPLANAAIFELPEGMVGFFVVSFLACALQAVRTKGCQAVFWNCAAGVSIGVGSYLRPDYVLLPIAIFFGLWAYTRNFWRSAFAIGIMQLTIILLLLPWAYRNHGTCGRWIFTSTSVGATLITGLGEYSNPWGFGASDDDREKQASEQGISSAWDCQGDRYFRELFAKSVFEHPGAYLMSVIRRLPLAVATPYSFGFANPWKTGIRFPVARAAGEDRYMFVMHRPLYTLEAYWEYLVVAGFTLVCLLSSIVMVLKQKNEAGLIFLIVSPHLYAIGTHILTHLEPRYLLPTMFAWLVGLAYVLSSGWDKSPLKDSRDPTIHILT